MGGCKSVPGAKVAPEADLDERSLEAVFDTAKLLDGNQTALKWCAEEHLENVTALISAEERLSQALGLKILERKRLWRSLGLDRDVGFDAVPDPPTKANLAEATENINKKLRIRMLSGNALEISMKAAENILSAKTQLRESDAFLKDKQFVLISQGIELMNRWSLVDCGLSRDAEVHLSLREAHTIKLEGLITLLQQAELMQYQFEFTFFLASFGAVDLNEIREYATATQLVDFVGLQDAERARFFSALDVEQFLKSKFEEANSKAEAAAEAQFQQWVIGHPEIIAPKELEGVYCICDKEPIGICLMPGWLEMVSATSSEDALSVWCFCVVVYLVLPIPSGICFQRNNSTMSYNRNQTANDSTWHRSTKSNDHLVKTFHRKSCGIISCETGDLSNGGILCCPRHSKAVRNAARDKFQRQEYSKAPIQQAMAVMDNARQHGWN